VFFARSSLGDLSALSWSFSCLPNGPDPISLRLVPPARFRAPFSFLTPCFYALTCRDADPEALFGVSRSSPCPAARWPCHQENNSLKVMPFLSTPETPPPPSYESPIPSSNGVNASFPIYGDTRSNSYCCQPRVSRTLSFLFSMAVFLLLVPFLRRVIPEIIRYGLAPAS